MSMSSYKNYLQYLEYLKTLADIGDDSPEIANLDNDVAAISTIINDIDTETDVIDNHFHSNERWFGAALVPNAEIHVADRIGTSVTAFQADAGNNTWGAWLQILGSSDTPAEVGKVMYDFHRIFISAVERSTSTHFIQIGYGDSGAAALASGTYTEFVYKPASATAEETPIVIQAKRHAAGLKAWVRVFVPAQNTGTVDFWVGMHEY